MDHTEKAGTGRRTRTRVREVNFMRVEDASIHDALAPFEMAVKERIAADDTRMNFEREEAFVQVAVRRVLLKRLCRLVKTGALTPRQREFYELFYVQHLSDLEISRQLGVSRGRIRKLRWQLKQNLMKAIGKQRDRENVGKKIRRGRLTKKQKQIWRLYSMEGLKPVQIAGSLGRTRQSVYWVLKKLKKIFSR